MPVLEFWTNLEIKMKELAKDMALLAVSTRLCPALSTHQTHQAHAFAIAVAEAYRQTDLHPHGKLGRAPPSSCCLLSAAAAVIWVTQTSNHRGCVQS